MRIHIECRRLSCVTTPIQASANKAETQHSNNTLNLYSQNAEMLNIFDMTAWTIKFCPQLFKAIIQ